MRTGSGKNSARKFGEIFPFWGGFFVCVQSRLCFDDAFLFTFGVEWPCVWIRHPKWNRLCNNFWWSKLKRNEWRKKWEKIKHNYYDKGEKLALRNRRSQSMFEQAAPCANTHQRFALFPFRLPPTSFFKFFSWRRFWLIRVLSAAMRRNTIHICRCWECSIEMATTQKHKERKWDRDGEIHARAFIHKATFLSQRKITSVACWWQWMNIVARNSFASSHEHYIFIPHFWCVALHRRPFLFRHLHSLDKYHQHHSTLLTNC